MINKCFQYDSFKLEVAVEKRSNTHNVKCSFTGIDKNHEKAYNAIFRFFNEIVWFYDLKISNINGGHSQNSHVQLNYNISSESYLSTFQQKVFKKQQHLALAFFREAYCNESPYYRFLCYRKIIETQYKKADTKEMIKWLESESNTLKNPIALHLKNKKLRTPGNKAFVDWLYINCRNPIVHANLDELIRDPNNYNDWDEIKCANEVMQELAEKIIVQKLKIPNR